MEAHDRGQVSQSAAEIYETFFVPALFQEWAYRVVEAAHIQPGQHVLDVACGTGVVARTAAERAGANGSVTGLDINEGMLGVAAQKASNITWKQGKAEALPFDDHTFDVIVSQSGLMFFEDRQAAIQEMMRVLKPQGRLAVAVWDTLDNTPGYASMVKLVQRLFGESAASGLRAPYHLGNVSELRQLFHDAGVPDVEINTLAGTALFPSIEAWVYTDIKGWVLADAVDDSQFELLVKEAQTELAGYLTDEGTVAFRAPAHIVTAAKD